MSDILAGIVAAKHCTAGHKWHEIGELYNLNSTTTRGKYLHRDKARFPKGIMPGDCPICNPESLLDNLVFRERVNEAEASTTGPRVQTLDQLLAAAEVDLDAWQVKDWGVKKWEVGAKIKTGHLEWDDGKIDGYLNYAGLGVQDLWSVWAKFIRKDPITLFPTIQPVTCGASFARPTIEAVPGQVRRALVGADAQFGFWQDRPGEKLVPFHDRRALDLFYQLAAYLQPDVILFDGDWNDGPELTDKFVRSAELRGLVQPAVEEGHWYRRRIREACQDSQMIEMEGNHEIRLLNYVINNFLAATDLRRADCVELGPVLSWPYLLALDALGIEWIGGYPDNEFWLGVLRVIHGDTVSNVPGGTARKIIEDSEESVLFGHIHRRESASMTKWGRDGARTIEARSVGCLCKIGGGVPARSDRNNWQQSMAIIDYTESEYSITDIEIRDGRAIYNGQIFEGRDYVDDLRRDNDRWRW